MLATPWCPSTNLIGTGSLAPAAEILFYAALLRWTRLRALYYAGPPLFFLAAAYSDASPLVSRRFANADDILGYYLLVIAAGVWAMELARLGTLPSLLFAEPFLFLAGGLTALHVVGGLRACSSPPHPTGGPPSSGPRSCGSRCSSA